MNNKQTGFTLIELVMVIVILGILAAFAIPRFADLGTDARKSAVQGIASSFKSAAAIAHSAALVDSTVSTTAATASITLEGQVVNLAYGYPTAADLPLAAQFDGTGYTGPTASGTDFKWTKDGTSSPDNCAIVYMPATATSGASVTADVSDCS